MVKVLNLLLGDKLKGVISRTINTDIPIRYIFISIYTVYYSVKKRYNKPVICCNAEAWAG